MNSLCDRPRGTERLPSAVYPPLGRAQGQQGGRLVTLAREQSRVLFSALAEIRLFICPKSNLTHVNAVNL